MNNKKLRLEFHDADIESVVENKDVLILNFRVVPIFEIKDDFGFEFEKPFFKKGQIKIMNPVCKTLPKVGEVFDGHIKHGEAIYELIPLNTVYKKPCLLYIQQESGDYFLYGDEIIVKVEG